MDEERWEQVNIYHVPVGTVLIRERYRWSRDGKPADSEYIRVVVGEHMTVSGMMRHLEPRPSVEWPVIPDWQMPYVYPGPNEYIWREK